MPRLTQTIQAMFDGVSQQPAALRRDTQCEEQENIYSTVADGAMKRPPMIAGPKLYNGTLGEAYVHTINRDVTERYAVVITNGDLKVYDLADGSQKTVAFPNGKGYLTATSPKTDFAAVTVADHTFIVNKTVTVALDATLGAGTLLGTLQKFSDLPDAPNSGDIYEIRGDNSSQFTSYYVKRTGGVWEEWKKPGIQDILDGATMPHKLVRESNGTFTFLQSSWDERIVGDEDSAPAPTFVGRKIRDLFFHRNRLGVLADENVIMSAASDYFNFWPGTVLDVLDSHPIDVAVSNDRVSILNHAVSFDRTLMVFSDQDQFALNAQEILSPATAAFNKATSFEASPVAKPTSAGPDLFFAADRGNYTSVRDYYVEESAVSNDAEDTTAHAPRYVPKNIDRLVASNAFDVLFLHSTDTPGTLYVYQYMWTPEGKVQSAWTKWTMQDADILSFDVVAGKLVMVNQYTDGVYLEEVDLEPQVVIPGLGFNIHLDRLASVTGVYDGINDWTTFTLPYSADVADAVSIVKGSAWTGEKGVLIDPATVTRPSATEVRAPGDLSANPCYLGLTYNARYVFSEQFARNREGASLDGRLQLRTMRVYYANTGYFGVKVTRATQESVQSVVPAQLDNFTGRTIGSTAFTLGEPAFASGVFQFPVLSHSAHAVIELYNDSYLASSFQKAEWSGTYVPRNRRP